MTTDAIKLAIERIRFADTLLQKSYDLSVAVPFGILEKELANAITLLTALQSQPAPVVDGMPDYVFVTPVPEENRFTDTNTTAWLFERLPTDVKYVRADLVKEGAE